LITPHVDADDTALGAHLRRRDEGIETAARAHVDDPLAGGEPPQRERIADPGEGLHRRVGHWIDDRGVVAEARRQRPSRMEVVLAMRIDGNFAVFLLDLLTQQIGVDDDVVVHGFRDHWIPPFKNLDRFYR
jgi:hypothetical protein